MDKNEFFLEEFESHVSFFVLKEIKRKSKGLSPSVYAAGVSELERFQW